MWAPIVLLAGDAATGILRATILSTKVTFGTAPALIERLGELKEQLGLSGIAAGLNPGGLLPFRQEMRSLEILTKQVMPAFK